MAPAPVLEAGMPDMPRVAEIDRGGGGPVRRQRWGCSVAEGDGCRVR